MTRRALIVLALLAGCACGHVDDAREIRRGVELVTEAATTAQVRSLTEAESDELGRAKARVRELADRMAEDAAGE